MKLIIDVWQSTLTEVATDSSQWSTLSVIERNKANSIKSDVQRERYIEVRVKLRYVLAHYLEVQPGELVFSLGKHGKPYLLNNNDLHFNISHSGDYLAIAVTHYTPIGIDIEKWKQHSDLHALVKRCFASEETSHWQALPDKLKQSEFYRFWTRKEALVKATGRGIGLGLDQCVISPENPTELLRIPEKYGPVTDWRLFDFDYPDGMSGSLAVKSRDFVVKIKLINAILP